LGSGMLAWAVEQGGTFCIVEAMMKSTGTGTQFTCFTSRKVQIRRRVCVHELLKLRSSVYLLY
jgi:hypothetical protein